MAAQHPLRIMFVITSMPVGGAEVLLVNLVRQLPGLGIQPEICCLKEPGPLGEKIGREFPLHSHLISHKLDVRVVVRLARLLRRRGSQAVVTVGAGDKMFWGRIAARLAGVPVVLSALHSTGWPDGISRLNRLLTPWTDGFIGVADRHGTFLQDQERLPTDKVFVIRNGIDTERFVPDPIARKTWRERLRIPHTAPVVGIVAALRPEKNHELFVQAARRVARQRTDAHFVVAGDGPMRGAIESWGNEWGIAPRLHVAGNVDDIPGLLAALDCFALTSHNEASPVSIMEAMSCCLPVVSTDVGSVSELVEEGHSGYLVPAGDAEAVSRAWLQILNDVPAAARMGERGRERIVARHSLGSMARGYADLVRQIYAVKLAPRRVAAVSRGPGFWLRWPARRAANPLGKG